MATMKIQVIKVELEQTPKYTMANITFKNLSFGKVESKKLPSFKNPDVYNYLSKAVDGDVFEVETVKDGQYWQWIKVTKVGAGETAAAAPSAPAAASGQTYRPTYETPEERAKRQVYIVRQSSIANAIALLAVGSKSPPDVETVIATARRFEDYVMIGDPIQALLDMPSDLPDVKV